MIRLGIIEDDDIVRQSVVSYFNGEAGFACLLEAASVEDFLASWRENIYLDIVLSDIGLPGITGIDGVRLIRKRQPKCQVVMLTVYDNTDKIFQALCAGACGYISKQTPLPKIREALRTVYEGGSYMSPGIARRITDYFNPIQPSQLHEKLTAREDQVLHAVEEGLTNKRIAARLGIAPETVKFHLKNIYLKLEVNNRMDIVRGRYR